MPSRSMPSRPTLARTYEVLAAIIAVTVVALAFLAGRFLFLGDLVIELHGYIGNAIFILAVVNLAIVLALRTDRLTAGVALAIVVFSFAQIGLGYVGRETADAAALHVPNGVLLMGLSAYQLATARQLRQAG